MAAKKNDKVLTADPEFCLGDANIALITSDGWVFCVHKGVLGRISVVFRNMFEDCRLPKPEPEQQAKFNNLDMIHISEPRVILKLFLAIVYDQKYASFIWVISTLFISLFFTGRSPLSNVMGCWGS